MNEKDIKKIIRNTREGKEAIANKEYWEELCHQQLSTRADCVMYRYGRFCAFEIKSDKDVIGDRFQKQIREYDLLFQYNTLIITNKRWEKDKEKIKKILPRHWGIAIANTMLNFKRLYHLRYPSENQGWSKADLLCFLWKSDLKKLANKYSIVLYNQHKYALAISIAEKMDDSSVIETVYNFLLERKKRMDKAQKLHEKRMEEQRLREIEYHKKIYGDN